MFRLAHGPSFQGKVCAVIYGYFDGSGTHDSSRVFSLCGFLGDPRMWDDLNLEWNRILDKPDWPKRPSEFHMYDCVHALREFEGWSLAQRLAIYGDLAGLITECNVLAIGSVCITDALKSCTQSERQLLAKTGLRSPMDVVFQLALQMAISRIHQYAQAHIPPIKEELSLIFDEEPNHVAERFHRLYNHHCRNHHTGWILNGIAFEKSHKLTPLQAADMLAYTTYHVELKKRFSTLSDFDFPVVPGFIRLIENVAASGGVFDYENVRRLLLTRFIDEANAPYALSRHPQDITLS